MPKTSKVKKKVTKAKTKTVNKAKPKTISKPKAISKGPIKISKTYTPKQTEKYMCPKHLAFFKKKLQLSNEDFKKIISEKPKHHSDYDIDIYNNYLFRLIKKVIKKLL